MLQQCSPAWLMALLLFLNCKKTFWKGKHEKTVNWAGSVSHKYLLFYSSHMFALKYTKHWDAVTQNIVLMSFLRFG